jgi:two-component system nitrate/nitrite response regulator NarL
MAVTRLVWTKPTAEGFTENGEARLAHRAGRRRSLSTISGVVLKHSPPQELSESIHKTLAGKVWFEQAYLKRVIERTTVSESIRPAATIFTERERHVLSLVFEGLANKEIANRLEVSESSVKSSLQQLLEKTGVRTRSQLVRVALEKFKHQL